MPFFCYSRSFAKAPRVQPEPPVDASKRVARSQLAARSSAGVDHAPVGGFDQRSPGDARTAQRDAARGPWSMKIGVGLFGRGSQRVTLEELGANNACSEVELYQQSGEANEHLRACLGRKIHLERTFSMEIGSIVWCKNTMVSRAARHQTASPPNCTLRSQGGPRQSSGLGCETPLKSVMFQAQTVGSTPAA